MKLRVCHKNNIKNNKKNTKKRTISILLVATILGVLAAGCGNSDTAQNDAIENPVVEGQLPEAQEPGAQVSETQGGNTEQSSEDDVVSGLTFEDLSKRSFSYCSGAGGWSEDFNIEKDGSFSGLYHDTDMGDSGDEYPEGTRYTSVYTGHFSGLTKISDTVYEVQVADISYEDNPGTEEYGDGFRYVNTTSPCFADTDTFTIYLPGTQVKDISEDVYWWLSSVNDNETELTMIAMADVTNGIGIYSYERMSPFEEAQMNYNSYKDSCDYYSNEATKAMTTAEMAEATAKRYELSDECLNKIWKLIKYNVDEENFDKILTEQREWIAEKDARGAEIMENEGSLAPVDYNMVLGDMTLTRCEELLEYLK